MEFKILLIDRTLSQLIFLKLLFLFCFFFCFFSRWLQTEDMTNEGFVVCVCEVT